MRSGRAQRIIAFGRFIVDLRRLARLSVSAPEAHRRVQEALARRDENFLDVVRRFVISNPRSPYRLLLEQAQCELGDLEQSIRTRGLESTLMDLRRAGVYVAFEEFKGRMPVVRDGRELQIGPEGFDNPSAKRSMAAVGGGSTGRPTQLFIDVDNRIDQTVLRIATDSALGFHGLPSVTWYEILPAQTGVTNSLRLTAAGNAPERWYYPPDDYPFVARLRRRLATEVVVAAARVWGLRTPRPRRLGLDEAVEIARWASDRVQESGGAYVATTASRAVRIAAAANAHGISLERVVLTVGSEPVTPAKVAEIARSGARAIPLYYAGEAGCVGVGCGNPVSVDDLHFCRHALALVTFPRVVPAAGTTVETFHLTTLLPTTPKILLNVESDDYGIVEDRSCGCAVEDLGFSEHIRQIFSFSKLTGEGVTLVGSDAVRILEDLLPARFGGTPLDYQLQEVEDASGLTRLNIVVSPRVRLEDESAVVRAFLDGLGSRGLGGSVRSVWQDAGTVRVKRAEPRTTSAGKLLPLMRLKTGEER